MTNNHQHDGAVMDESTPLLTPSKKKKKKKKKRSIPREDECSFHRVFEVDDETPVSEKYVDDEHDVTYSRKIARFLSRYNWYCPNKDEDGAVGRAALNE
jgi:hypothetical protein